MGQHQIVRGYPEQRGAGMSKIADDSASIAQRLKELEAERLQAVTGSSAPEQPKEVDTGFGEYAMGWPYSPSGLKSLAHPEWPYIGTPYEWKRW